MLKTVQSRVLAALAALGLSAGAVVVLNERGCTVTPAPVVELVPEVVTPEVTPVEVPTDGGEALPGSGQ